MLTDEQRKTIEQAINAVGWEPTSKEGMRHIRLLRDSLRELLATSAAPAEGRECCNADCGWVGPASETVQMKHGAPDNLCPNCYEVTEAATAPTKPVAWQSARLAALEEAIRVTAQSQTTSHACDAIRALATAPTMGEAARAFSDEDARRLYDAACLTVMQRKRTRITFDAWCAEFIPALLAEIERIDRAACQESGMAEPKGLRGCGACDSDPAECAWHQECQLSASAIWRAIGEEAECVVQGGKNFLLLSEEMCTRLGTSIDRAAAKGESDENKS